MIVKPASNSVVSEPPAVCFSEGANTLDGVDIFAAGEHRGKEYTPADLDRIVANFKSFSTGSKPGFRVPLVLGHEEDQQFLDRSDLPAAGWAANVYRDGDTLKADFADVPEKVARLLRGKRYRTVSAEIYDQPPEGLSGEGKMLRRVALLGGDIPQVKSLDDIPTPSAHSEKPRFADNGCEFLALTQIRPSATRGAFWCYAENRPMTVSKFGPEPGSAQSKAMWAKMSLSGAKKKDGSYSPRKYKKGTPKGGWGFSEGKNSSDDDRSKMIDYLAEAGLDADAIKDAPDQALAEMCRFADGSDAEEPTDEPGREPDPYSENDSSDGLADHALDNLPEPSNAEEANRYAEHARKYAARIRRHAERVKKYLEKYCSASRHDEEPDMDKKEPAVEKHSESRQLVELIRNEIRNAIDGPVKQSIARLEKFRAIQEQSQQQQSVEAFCEAQLRAGHLTASEYTSNLRGGPGGPVYRRLLRASPSRIVEQFREHDKNFDLTELQSQMKEIEERPTLFAEHFGSPLQPAPSADGGESIVLAHFDKFREEYRDAGYSRDSFLSNFKELDDAKKGIMLEDYRKSLQS